jgi:hypothetical protein
MIGLLVRALADRAKEVARWENGYEAIMVEPRPVNQSNSATMDDMTVEFRLEVRGEFPKTYIVTVSEVSRR